MIPKTRNSTNAEPAGLNEEDDQRLKTLAFRLPYDRKRVESFVERLQATCPSGDDLTGLVVAVDHRTASAKAWVVATFDVATGPGKRAYDDLKSVPPFELDADMTDMEYVFHLASQGECNLVGFTGIPEQDAILLAQCWPPTSPGIH